VRGSERNYSADTRSVKKEREEVLETLEQRVFSCSS